MRRRTLSREFSNPSPKNKFVPAFLPLAEEIARLGAINSLSQVILKLTSPGVPDIYQGNEIWDFSLVDPDNRRPVDYQQRREMLDSLSKTSPDELLANWPDGRIKMLVTQRLLHFRRENPRPFSARKLFPTSRQRSACGIGCRLCARARRQMDCRHRSPSFVARRFSANRRALAGYGD